MLAQRTIAFRFRHQCSAIEQILSQDRNFFVPQLHVPWLDHIDERVIEKVGAGEFEGASVGIDLIIGVLETNR